MRKSKIAELAFRAITQKLETIGFETNKLGIYKLAIDTDVLGWVGLNTCGQKPGLLEVNPVVGVRHQTIEKLLAELLSESYDAVNPPTLAGNIGYLSPDNKFRQFSFSMDADPLNIADALVQDIERYGLPFMKRNIDLNVFLKTMKSTRFGISEQLNYRIPLCLYLLGRFDETSQFLSTKLLQLADRTDHAAKRYFSFESQMRSFLLNKTFDL